MLVQGHLKEIKPQINYLGKVTVANYAILVPISIKTNEITFIGPESKPVRLKPQMYSRADTAAG